MSASDIGQGAPGQTGGRAVSDDSGVGVAAGFDFEERWPELFARLDQTQRRAVRQSMAISWHAGWTPNREDVENLIVHACGAIDDAEYRRRVDAIAERNGRAVAMGARPSDDGGALSAMVEVRGE